MDLQLYCSVTFPTVQMLKLTYSLTTCDSLKTGCFLWQEQCRLPQMHLLSVFMAPRMHAGCAPNCEDRLAQMPEIVSLKILSLLDPG